MDKIKFSPSFSSYRRSCFTQKESHWCNLWL